MSEVMNVGVMNVGQSVRIGFYELLHFSFEEEKIPFYKLFILRRIVEAHVLRKCDFFILSHVTGHD